MRRFESQSTTLEPLMNSDAAAELLGFSPLTVRRMAHEGRLPSIAFPVGKTGKFTHRFRASDLRVYLTGLERHPTVNVEIGTPVVSDGARFGFQGRD